MLNLFPNPLSLGSFLVSCFGQQNVIEVILGFPGGSVVKNPPAKAGDSGDAGLIPGVKKLPWRRKWQPTPVFLPEESHGQRTLVCGVTKGGTRLSDFTFTFNFYFYWLKCPRTQISNANISHLSHQAEKPPYSSESGKISHFLSKVHLSFRPHFPSCPLYLNSCLSV